MGHHVCPVWVGYLLASPLRRLSHNPHIILNGHVGPGMKVLDVGCAMGFFSLPMAEMVGPEGKVLCIDLQPKMLVSLEKRAKKVGVRDRLEMRVCPRDRLGLDAMKDELDFALAFAVVHEVPDAAKLFAELHSALKPQGRLLVAEPSGHVSGSEFDKTLSLAERNGFKILDRPEVKRSHAAVLKKK